MKRLLFAFAAVLVGALGVTVASQRSAAAMSSAAEKWLASLAPDQKQRATFSFDSDERQHWHYVPNEQFPRKGVQIKEMTDAQRALAWDLLKTGVSARGFSTARSIMELENILKSVEAPNGQFARDHEAYQFSVFGTPGDKKAWGWRFEGHHVSIRFDVVNGSLTSSTPSFFGANPAEVRVDVSGAAPRGTRVLGPEEDAARALLDALDASEKTTAIVANAAPNEMLTSNKLKADPQSPLGLKASAMTPGQREKLMALIEVYSGYMVPDVAAERMDRLKKAGLDNIAFAWCGEVEKGKKHYYRV
ncbi:MAG TPA: DUF3500 domain-containing protein, partial [Vicinamibacterales bacterium]|nr:DUF3500 domain-containing protein [Vicinamibacterales bacterium]